jgi:O-antigen ligase
MSSYRQQMKMFLLVLVVSLLGTLALTWVVTNTTAGQMFAQRATFVQQYDVAVNGRFAAQSGAVEIVGTNPVGVGPGMANDFLDGVAPHNVYLHVGVEAGWLGAISFLAFALLSLWRGLSGSRRADSPTRLYLQIALAATVGVLVQSLFIDSTHWRHLWVLFAVLWGLTASGNSSASKSWST